MCQILKDSNAAVLFPQAAGNCLFGEATCPDNIILEGTLSDWPEMFQKVAAAGDSKNTSI